jgi:hypothetical protein
MDEKKALSHPTRGMDAPTPMVRSAWIQLELELFSGVIGLAVRHAPALISDKIVPNPIVSAARLPSSDLPTLENEGISDARARFPMSGR